MDSSKKNQQKKKLKKYLVERALNNDESDKKNYFLRAAYRHADKWDMTREEMIEIIKEIGGDDLWMVVKDELWEVQQEETESKYAAQLASRIRKLNRQVLENINNGEDYKEVIEERDRLAGEFNAIYERNKNQDREN